MKFCRSSVFLCAFVIAGCGYNGLGAYYDTSVYVSLKESSPEAYSAHADLLREIIDNAEEEGVLPPPGICAEYAFYMARIGNYDQGAYLAKEVKYYPESAKFVAVLERLLQGGKNVLSNAPTLPLPEETH